MNASSYRIPPDNPYVGNPKYLPEIWALGLRNPWRFGFDRQTGDLYIGDVGQWLYEELDYQPASSHGGENYGWSAFEGFHTYLNDQLVLGAPTWPIVEYSHDLGQCIIGGYVYRGKALPELVGKYIYGDYIYGEVWILERDASGQWQNHLFMGSTGFNISAFAEDSGWRTLSAGLQRGHLSLDTGLLSVRLSMITTIFARKAVRRHRTFDDLFYSRLVKSNFLPDFAVAHPTGTQMDDMCAALL